MGYRRGKTEVATGPPHWWEGLTAFRKLPEIARNNDSECRTALKNWFSKKELYVA